jgi:hypothetical protein
MASSLQDIEQQAEREELERRMTEAYLRALETKVKPDRGAERRLSRRWRRGRFWHRRTAACPWAMLRALSARCRPQDSSLEILSELVPYEDPKVQALEAKLKEKSE